MGLPHLQTRWYDLVDVLVSMLSILAALFVLR